MKKKINHLFRTFALLTLAGVLCCCTDDREGFEPPKGAKQKEVTFSVQIPVPSLPSTYGLNATSENEVKTIDILLFDSGTGNLTGSTLSANSIANSGTNNSTKTFTVKIPEGTYTVVILANCRDILTAAMPAINGLATKSKANVLEKLSLSQSSAWVADAANASYKPFPMWGEMPLTVSSSMPATNNMKLTRMLAKIDVSVHSALQGDFKLTSVHLYNRYTQGSVAPLAANWSSSLNKVTAPSVLGIKTAAALSYTVDTPFKQYLNEIYTFEAEVGAAGTLSTNTCLVVGGKYDGSSVETFYRIDFVKKTGNTVTYLPLLRNHRYDVDIKTIEAPGYATAAAAFAAKPVNIKADISVFDESKITKTVYDDQYMLGVSDDDITFTREARTATHPDNTLSVSTDVPSGWKVLKIIDGSNTDVNIDSNPSTGWIRLNPNNKNNAGTSDTKLILSDNTTGSPRSAVIHLIAGRLTLPVKITQTTASALMLSLTNTSDVEINELVFPSKVGLAPDAQPVRLRWMPVSQAVSVSTAAWGSSLAFKYNTTSTGISRPGASGETSYSDPSGIKSLNIQPEPMTAAELTGNPFLEKISKVDFTVSNSVGGYIAKSLFLRQFVYNMVPVVESVYLMDGTSKSFSVRTNSPFTVSIQSNPSSVISNLSTSGAPNTAAGTPVSFNIKDDLTNPTLYQKDVVVTIKSTKGVFPDTDVTLNCAAARIQQKSNSYIVAPGGIGILIPVERCNDSPLLGTVLTAADTFTADLVWTDNSNHVATNSNVSLVRPVAGSGSNLGYVLVMPGNAQGNAVVAIKKGGTILWSWHIWVTSYAPPTSPDRGTFMDRNLGAISNTHPSAENKGLLYQWGRKDPFPGSSSLTGTADATLYDADTGIVPLVKAPVPTSTASPYNLRNSVQNPTTFYFKTSGNYDWYSSGNKVDNKLWDTNTKAVYDPCPPGWRIPSAFEWTNTGWAGYHDFGSMHYIAQGFFPAAGQRNYYDGRVDYSGDYGMYWGAYGDYMGWGGFITFFSRSPGNGAGIAYHRALGASVRCVFY